MTAVARFVRRYSVGGSGAAFMTFVRIADGARVDVKVKSRFGECDRYTRREARIVAEDKLAGCPAVWRVVCDDYATEPTTLDGAVRLADDIARLGACFGQHVLSNGSQEIAC